jgi:hypothetical protein
MAAKKKPGTGRKTAVRRGARGSARSDQEAGVPASLKELSRKLGRELTLLEKQIETTSHDAVRHCTRVLRNVSHLLGRLEAAGEAEWRRSNEARREAIRAVRELEGIIEPPKGERPAPKKTRRRKSGGAAGDKRARPATRSRGGTRGSPRRRD